MRIIIGGAYRPMPIRWCLLGDSYNLPQVRNLEAHKRLCFCIPDMI
jgi:hypothetical protein